MFNISARRRVFLLLGDATVRSHLYLAGKILLATAVLFLLWRARLIDAHTLAVLLGSPELLSAAILLMFVANVLVAARWYVLLHTQCLPIRFQTVLRVSYAAGLTGMVVPGTVGTDIARIGLGLAFPDTRLHELTLSIVADRVAGLLGLMAVGLVAGILCLNSIDSGTNANFAIRMLIATIAGTLGLVVLGIVLGATLAPKIGVYIRMRDWANRGIARRMVARMLEVASLYRGKYNKLILALLLSMTVHALTFASLTLIASGMHVTGASPWKFMVAGVLAAVANGLPITPGGIGVGEAAFAQVAVWLQPAVFVPPYATAYLAYRMVVIGTLLPALAFMPNWRTFGTWRGQ